jgi:hypothetical protein
MNTTLGFRLGVLSGVLIGIGFCMIFMPSIDLSVTRTALAGGGISTLGAILLAISARTSRPLRPKPDNRVPVLHL